MKMKFLFIGEKGETLGWSGPYRVLGKTFKKGDILVQDDKFSCIFRVENKRRKDAFTTDINPAIQQNLVLPLNFDAFMRVLYVKFHMPVYGLWGNFFKTWRGW